MYQTRTRSVNGGCVIMIVGLASLAYGLLAAYAIRKANHAVDPEKYAEFVRTLTYSCPIALLLGLALIVIGLRLAKRVRDFDPNDPDEPMMKF